MLVQTTLRWAPALLGPPALLAAPTALTVVGASDGTMPHEEIARQVRIERHMSIRITARPGVMDNDALFQLLPRMSRPHIKERKIGKCVANAAIGGMTIRNENQLLLYLRDQRTVVATLNHTCSARDFYSGFYMAHSADGLLCAGRDMLLSRSGTECKIKQFRQLVDKAR